MRLRTLALTTAAVLFGGLAQAQTVDPARMSEITKAMSSDPFMGRAPGGPGEKPTIDYLIAQFKAAGMEPAGENGGWTQRVPLLRTFVPKDAAMSFSVGGQALPLRQGEEISILSLRPTDRVTIAKAPLVFVSYGVSAPERGWDDYKGVDLKGKVAVFLINDPDFEAKAGEDPIGKFGGQAATYYARWTYKHEEAARRGAVASIIIHETPGAGYGWTTAVASNGEGFDVVRADPAKDKVLLQAWLGREVGADLLKRSGQDLEALKVAARRKDFRPIELKDATFSADFALKHEQVDSQNVLGKITGAKRPNESIMYAGHWDAYGIGPASADGKTIRPGALDDAIGLAGMIEIARLFKTGPAPDRSVVFAAWTAEERGLLGSEYYGEHPTLPLETTAANYTMDVLQTAGPAKDVVLIGYGQNELEADLAKAAARQNRVVTPDAKPERALFYRADHFSLARRGVPVLLLMGLGGGHDLVEGGRAAGDAWVADYTAKCYHQTCDAWSPNMDFRGAAQDAQLLFEMGKDVANSNRWPDWNDGSEFKPIRAQSAAARK